MALRSPNIADRGDTTTFLGPIGVGKSLTPQSPYKKSFIAGATIGARRIVKFAADGTSVIHAAARTDPSIGVTTNTEDVPAGESVDVVIMGETEVTLQAGVLGGTFITAADTEGRAGLALVGNRTAGFAMQTVIVGTAPTVTVFVNIGVADAV